MQKPLPDSAYGLPAFPILSPWNPNFVHRSLIAPGPREKAAFSNSGTMAPRPNIPGLPLPDVLSSEYFFASSEKLVPFLA